MKPCTVNPKTSKPYSRHRYTTTNLRVVTYSTSYGVLRPHGYAYEIVCERCGYNAGTKTY